MKLWSQSMTGALKMIGIFSLLALLTPVFSQEAADAVSTAAEAVSEAAAAVEEAAEEAPAYESYEAFTESPGFALFTVNNLWLLISAALVFLMHLGFSTVESGLY